MSNIENKTVLIEFYDTNGKRFAHFVCSNEIEAIKLMAEKTQKWRGQGFKNCSCYCLGKELWNLEIKD